MCGADSRSPAPTGKTFCTRRILPWGYRVSPDGSCPLLSVSNNFFFAPLCGLSLGAGERVSMTRITGSVPTTSILRAGKLGSASEGGGGVPLALMCSPTPFLRLGLGHSFVLFYGMAGLG